MVRVFMRANTIMKMTRVVTLLFSDKKSEEEKGAVEWILLQSQIGHLFEYDTIDLRQTYEHLRHRL